jgi:hypothetical protein
MEYFAEFYGWKRDKYRGFHPGGRQKHDYVLRPGTSDRFFGSMNFMLTIQQDRLLKDATERKQLSNNNYALMKDVAKKFIPRIRKCFGQDIAVAIDKKTPLQDAEALLDSSTKLTYRWAAGIIASNHIATILIQLSRFKSWEKRTDDIKALYDSLKNRTTNRNLKSFLVRSFRRFEDANKLRNRCAHVIEGEPTKQEIQQSIALARLLQKHVLAASRRSS